MDAEKLLFPLLNPNEPEAMLVSLEVTEGQEVQPGQALYTLETTKSASEVTAEASGFIVGIQAEVGDTVNAGDLFAYLALEPDWEPAETMIMPREPKLDEDTTPEGLRITEPALALARQHNLDLNALPKGRILIEENIQKIIQEQGGGLNASVDAEFDASAMVVYGGGGHGKAVIELIQAMKVYTVAGVLDDGLETGDEILGVKVLGGSDQLTDLHADGIRLGANAVGGIGNPRVRVEVFDKMAQAGLAFPTLVHPSAVVEASAKLAAGVHVFPQAYLGSEASVGMGTIINTGAIVSHDCSLGAYVNISPGAILAGNVTVGELALIGMGVTVNLGVTIGSGAKIGNGATIKEDVPENAIVRAGTVWPR